MCDSNPSNIMADISLVNVKTEFIRTGRDFVVPVPSNLHIDEQPIFESHSVVEEEESNHHGNNPVTFCCWKCEGVFSSRRLLLRHRSRKLACIKRCKLSSQRRKYTCPICSVSFIRYEHLQRHQAKKHGIGADEGLPYSCKECQECFSTISNLQDHSRFKHRAPRLQCPTCDKSFVFNKRLLTHTKNCTGTSSPSTICEYCGKKFKHHSYLQTHLEVVHGNDVKQWVCDICGNVFIHKGSMYRHRKSCVKPTVPRLQIHCQFCSKCFTTTSRLTTHLQHTHSQHIYTCHLCQAKFTRKQSMHVHVNKCLSGTLKRRRVDPALPIECPTCGKLFKKREYMEHHRDVAHGDGSKRHSCDKCGCSFAYKGSMYRHRKQCKPQQQSSLTHHHGNNSASFNISTTGIIAPSTGEIETQRPCHSGSLIPTASSSAVLQTTTMDSLEEEPYSPTDVSMELIIDENCVD